MTLTKLREIAMAASQEIYCEVANTNARNNYDYITTFSPAMVLKLLEVVDCALELQEIFAPGFDREHIDCFTIQPMNTALAALKGTE